MAKRLPGQVRTVFSDLLSDAEWTGVSVPAIYREACLRLSRLGLSESEWPSEAWAYKHIAAYRKDLTDRDKWLARPFTLASLSDQSFPSGPAAVEFLGKLYRRSIVGGSTLSNRRAIWAARLSHFFPENEDSFWRLYWAWYWVKRYADLEFSRALVGDPDESIKALDRDLLMMGWPDNKLVDRNWPKVPQMLLVAPENFDTTKKEFSKFRRLLREKLKELNQLHLMPEAWDDIIAERYLHIADLLNGSYGNESWNKSLSSSEYDTAFLALRTVMDRSDAGKPVMELQTQLELADQIVTAVRVDDSKLVQRLIDESGMLKEVNV